MRRLVVKQSVEIGWGTDYVADGFTVHVQVAIGVAQAFQEYDARVSDIRFDGATPDQVAYMIDFLNQAACAAFEASTSGG